MKKVLFWLAGVFNVDLTVEKIIYRDKIIEIPKEVFIEKEIVKEVIKEVPVEVIVEKEVIKEVPFYKDVQYIALKDEVTDDTYVDGDLIVSGYMYVNGEVSCYKIKED